ncbi:TPA: hypothetical protein VEO38_000196 [Providencia alcalifaciens]|nr:hypothetical protein [Providencia alcalifaciens]
MRKNQLWRLLSVVIFIGMTLAIFFYFKIDDNNKWSTFFSFTSTFGIIATIWVYRSQKKESKKSDLDKINSICSLLLTVIGKNTNFNRLNKDAVGGVKLYLSHCNIHSPISENDICYIVTKDHVNYQNIYKLTNKNMNELLFETSRLDMFLFEKIGDYIDIVNITNMKIRNALFSNRTPEDIANNIKESLDEFIENQDNIINDLRQLNYIVQ